MTAAAEGKPPVEFAGYRVDRFRRRLTTLDGTPVPVSSRAFDTLLVLLEKPGEVVTKQELISAVWPTTVVEDNNLTQAVSALRKALGDTQERPQIVLTVPGRGYSLIAAVRTVAAEAPAVPSPVAANRRPTARKLGWHGLGLGLAALAAIGAVLVWARQADPGVAASAAMAPDAATLPSSVAVLPFTVVGAEPRGNESFVLGLHDEVVTQLSRIRGLRVIARNAMLRYRGDARPAAEIARELKVGAVLEGTVRTAGRQVRINLQLSDAATQVTLWSDSYAASLDDLGELFTAQADIASNVAKALAVELLPQELERAARIPTDSAQAYQHYLGALAAIAANDFGSALAELEQTVALDPEFVEAWYRLANVNNIMVAIPVTSPSEHLDRAAYAARQALALDPGSVNAHSVMGSILYARGDFAGAERELDEAQRLRPSTRSMADNQFRADEVMLRLALGDFASARAKSEELLAYYPIHLVGISYLMLAEEYSGNHVGAMQQYARGKALMRTWWGENPGLWIALGRRDAAHLAGAVHDFRDFPLRNVLELYDQPAAAIAELESMRTRLASLPPAQQLNAAFFAAYFSRDELAMDFLEAGLRANGASLYVIWLPVLSDVRRTERFKAFLRERGLVDYWQQHGWPDVCTPSAEGFSCR